MKLMKFAQRDAIPYIVESLFGGSDAHPIYSDVLIPRQRRHPMPVVMVHGGCNTGTCFLRTPDGRPGWAHDFAAAGIETYVIDWPGHGRSPMRDKFLSLSSRDVRDSIAVFLRQIGPSILLAHSAGGPLIWSLAETCDDLVGGLIGVAPGPPANLVPTMDAAGEAKEGVQEDAEGGFPIKARVNELFFVDEDFVREYWFSGPAAPEGAAASFYRSVVPESPRIINERFNVTGDGIRVDDPMLVGRRPTLIVGPECDPRHPRHIDQATADMFGAELVWLPDHGINGNGHMMMGDTNSQAIADLIVKWILETVPGSSAFS
ncbi:alpha/beta fold hydrolase [Sphingobium sp.]|uniref:alpha/beta fold hydrolase n=1 Tax=Sphingobium sp. TaxID=1912891 RepID=UPI0028BDA05E|nr:alpha/beta fold hydrolase [Sphingobium sp.]